MGYSVSYSPCYQPWEILWATYVYEVSRKRAFHICKLHIGGPGSSVGIATGYGLNGPGIESRWGLDIPHLSRPNLGPTQSPVQWVPGLSRG
jgi:hypothetical protein